jgi:phosphoglycerol transferase
MKSKLNNIIGFLLGSVLLYFLSIIIISGSYSLDKFSFSTPYLYGGGAGDTFAFLIAIERIGEGSVYHSLRMGWPFGSNSITYPFADIYVIALIKGLFAISSNAIPVLNTYIVISLILTFYSAYYVLRKLLSNDFSAFVGGILFSVASFSIDRIFFGHFTYILNIPIPLYFFFAIKLIQGEGINKCIYYIIFVSLGFFGIYYSLFGAIIIFSAGIINITNQKKIRAVMNPLICLVGILSGLLIALTPSIYYQYQNKNSPNSIIRNSAESEIYGLKIIQLTLPRDGHQVKKLAELKEGYNKSNPLVNENSSASLGLFGIIGFFLSFFIIIFSSNLRMNKNDNIYIFSQLIFILFLFGTIGGLGSIFSHALPIPIRAWNRVAIFIDFAALAILLLLYSKLFICLRHRLFLTFILFLTLSLGIFDQLKSPCKNCVIENIASYYDDKKFINSINETENEIKAIYQMPYMPYPESPPLYGLKDYELGLGFVHSKNLNWSYGVIKNSPGDQSFKELSKKSISEQISVIKRMGFAGVYFDSRGLSSIDSKSQYDQLVLNLGAPKVVHNSKNIYYFSLY